MSENTTNTSINRAKMYQLVLFPFNNGATNVYYILTLNFIAYYGNGVLGLALMFATTMVTAMRFFDALTDPIIGALIDKTTTKWGKFRPFMVLGNIIMAVSAILLYFGTRVVSVDTMWLRYALFTLFYALYVIGYTFQTACTRSGQTCLTNDPNQRPLFTIFNTVASLIGMGLIQFLAPILQKNLGGYNSPGFFNVMVPLAIVVSAILTVLAIRKARILIKSFTHPHISLHIQNPRLCIFNYLTYRLPLLRINLCFSKRIICRDNFYYCIFVLREFIQYIIMY